MSRQLTHPSLRARHHPLRRLRGSAVQGCRLKLPPAPLALVTTNALASPPGQASPIVHLSFSSPHLGPRSQRGGSWQVAQRDPRQNSGRSTGRGCQWTEEGAELRSPGPVLCPAHRPHLHYRPPGPPTPRYPRLPRPALVSLRAPLRSESRECLAMVCRGRTAADQGLSLPHDRDQAPLPPGLHRGGQTWETCHLA